MSLIIQINVLYLSHDCSLKPQKPCCFHQLDRPRPVPTEVWEEKCSL
jgi:hypothetical protein